MKELADHEIVTGNVTAALLMLVEKRIFDDITITGLSRKTGVERVSFRRSCNDRQNILPDYLCREIEQLRPHFIRRNADDFYETFRRALRKKNRKDGFLLPYTEENNVSYKLKEHIFHCPVSQRGEEDGGGIQALDAYCADNGFTAT